MLQVQVAPENQNRRREEEDAVQGCVCVTESGCINYKTEGMILFD